MKRLILIFLILAMGYVHAQKNKDVWKSYVHLDEESKKQGYLSHQGKGIQSIYDRGYTNYTGIEEYLLSDQIIFVINSSN